MVIFCMLLTGIGFSVNAQTMHVEQLSENRFKFDVKDLPDLPCKCPELYNQTRFAYFWRFGDGGYSKNKNPIYEYKKIPANGIENVSLKVIPIYTDEDPDIISNDTTLFINAISSSTFRNENENVLQVSYASGDQLHITDNSVAGLVPGYPVTYAITYLNDGSTFKIVNKDTNKLSYVSHESFCNDNFTTFPLTFLNREVYNWQDNSSNNCNGASYKRIFITFMVDPSVVPGEHIEIDFVSRDSTIPGNSTLHSENRKDVVSDSFDPNEKEGSHDFIAGPDVIEYYVHFQNIGEGDARTIIIEDKIDPMLDFDQLYIQEVELGTSILDPNEYSVRLDSVARSFEVHIQDVNLPGTGNPVYNDCAEDLTTGYVKFKIPTIYFDQTTVSDLSSFYNQANIFFDDNSPIQTEPVYTQIDYYNEVCTVNRTYQNQIYFSGSYEWLECMEDIDADLTTEVGAELIYDAGNSILLKEGTFLKSGSKFLGQIEGCNAVANNAFKMGMLQEETKNSDLKAYPNPFSQQSQISFNMNTAGRVSLDVYNSESKHMLNLIDNGFKRKGPQTLEFTADLPSGMYFLELKTEDSSEQFKLMKVD